MNKDNIYFEINKIYKTIEEKLNKSKIDYSKINIYDVSLELSYKKNVIKTKYYYVINNNKVYGCLKSFISYKDSLVKNIEKNKINI